MRKIKNLRVEEAAYERILEFAKKNGLSVFEMEDVEELIDFVMPNAAPKHKAIVLRELERKASQFTIQSKAVRDMIVKIMKAASQELEASSEKREIGQLPSGINLSGVHASLPESTVEREVLERLSRYKNKETFTNLLKALNKIPEKYRQGVFENVIYNVPFDPTETSKSSWHRWKQKFIYWFAELEGLGPVIYLTNL